MAYGTGLGPSAIAISATPFQTNTIGGTTIEITVNGKTLNAPMYYASATQVAGMVPSNTPTGTGTFTVTYQGETSAPAPIQIVQNNFGTFAVSQAGYGDAILTFADYSLVSGQNAANPGDTVILWGTGLGPVAGNETGGPLPGDMANVPVEVWVGGISANVIYRGRSGCCIAEDQIVFTIPAGIAGCAVPMAVQINSQVSNFTNVVIAASGRVCTPAASPLPPNFAQQTAGKSTVTVSSLSLTRLRSIPANVTGSDGDGGGGAFEKVVPAAAGGVFTAFTPLFAYGSCSIVVTGPATVSGNLPVYLDAGPSLTVNGPNGTRTVPARKTTFGLAYDASLGDSTPGNYLDPGHYTVSGSGGADIGAFTASVVIASPPFVVTNTPESLTTIDRSKGLNVTWTGGATGSTVYIQGTIAEVGPGTSVAGGTFVCYAQASAGQFTVPAYVFAALPANGSIPGAKASNSLAIVNYVSNPFTAPGLDAGVISASSEVFTEPVLNQ